jgi:MerR family transcriptional regulator, light-induced transcriptional regulator
MTTGPGGYLAEKASAIADDVVDADYARRPELLTRFGERGRALYHRDCLYHLSFLTEAVARAEPALFIDYVAWAKSMLAAHGVPASDLAENLRLLQWAIGRHVPPEEAAAAAACIEASLEQLPSMLEPPTFLSSVSSSGQLARDYLDLLLKVDRKAAVDLIDRAMRDGLPLRRLYLDVFQQSQREVGRLWQLNQITVAQEHYCTGATQAIMNKFLGQVLATPRIGRTVTAFCVAGDQHEIGLRIVADFFELAGWDCTFLGANMPIVSLPEAIAAAPPDLIAISATMAFHVGLIETFIRALRAHPDVGRIPVLVGGRPFSLGEKLWQRIGADGVAYDAESAVLKGVELVRGR